MKKGIERKSEFIPILTEAFVELGYARATSAELARRCGVRENELYRIWKSKPMMFLEVVQFIYHATLKDWKAFIDKDRDGTQKSVLEKIIQLQTRDHGRGRFYRIVFSGIVETQDKETRDALRDLYLQFHQTLARYVEEHRIQQIQSHDRENRLSADEVAWMLMGISAITDIQRELDLLPPGKRSGFLKGSAMALLDKL